MTRLTLAARNLLVQTPEVKAFVAAGRIGGGPKFRDWKDGWVFADKPYAKVENLGSYSALIVVSDGGSWQAPNSHNTARFPRFFVDIWASPTRNVDRTPKHPDADLLIEKIFEGIRPYLHTIDMGVPGNSNLDPTLPYLGKPGHPRFWGTASEIASRSGVLIMSSEQLSEPDFSDVSDGDGARMGRYSFGAHTA